MNAAATERPRSKTEGGTDMATTSSTLADRDGDKGFTLTPLKPRYS